MIDMIAKVILFGILATAVLSMPIGPGDDEEDIPTYTEKVLPNKPTQVPKFGAKKITASRKAPEKHHTEKKRTYALPVHTALVPKDVLKTSKPIRGSSRPIRRTNKILRKPDPGYNDLKPSYEAPAPVFVPVQDLGVEYAPEVSAPNDHGLVDDYEPRRVHKGPIETPRGELYKSRKPSTEAKRAHPVDVVADYGSAVGNAPQLRYALAPEKFASAAAQVRDVPDYGYSGNSYEDKPQPYIFGYELKDENGSTQSRKEQGDDYGNKRGSYGYTDGYGIYRQVDYVADAHGFRAVIKTNEPGTENQDPADVQMQSEAQKY